MQPKTAIGLHHITENMCMQYCVLTGDHSGKDPRLILFTYFMSTKCQTQTILHLQDELQLLQCSLIMNQPLSGDSTVSTELTTQKKKKTTCTKPKSYWSDMSGPKTVQSNVPSLALPPLHREEGSGGTQYTSVPKVHNY